MGDADAMEGVDVRVDKGVDKGGGNGVDKEAAVVGKLADSGGDAAAEPTPAEMPGHMMQAVERFNAQLERIAEVAVVLVVGALLSVVDFGAEVLWFVPLLLFVIRPLAVYLGLVGARVERSQRRLIAWFGIRGIGSIYYLMYAITHDLQPAIAKQLLSITLAVVVASVLLHGVSVTPLMRRYEARKKNKRGRAIASAEATKGAAAD